METGESLWRKFHFWCAPMEGVMRGALLAACNRLQLAESWLTPFLRISQNVPQASQIRDFMAPFEPEKRPVVLQLMGVDPVKMAECARAAVALGAAGIDLNLGCPSRQVTRRGAGAGGLRPEYRETAFRVAEALREALPEGRFSIKMRSGWESFGEFPALLGELTRRAAPDAVTVHFRTAREGYRPVPERLERFAAVGRLAGASQPLWLLNGDLTGEAEIRRLMRETGASGAMLGRGFWRDPWILRRLAHPEGAFPAPEEGRRLLWHAVLTEMRRGGKLPPRGKAVEWAHLILGADAPAARSLRRLSDADFPRWLEGAPE